MADRVVIIDKGAVQQIGTPDEVRDNPANRFVREFLDLMTASRLKGRAPIPKLSHVKTRQFLGGQRHVEIRPISSRRETRRAISELAAGPFPDHGNFTAGSRGRYPARRPVFDVREKEEFLRGHLPNAAHLGRGTLELEIEQQCLILVRKSSSIVAAAIVPRFRQRTFSAWDTPMSSR